MAWCRQTWKRYLYQSWPRSVLVYGVNRLEWINAISTFLDPILYIYTILHWVSFFIEPILWKWLSLVIVIGIKLLVIFTTPSKIAFRLMSQNLVWWSRHWCRQQTSSQANVESNHFRFMTSWATANYHWTFNFVCLTSSHIFIFWYWCKLLNSRPLALLQSI